MSHRPIWTTRKNRSGVAMVVTMLVLLVVLIAIGGIARWVAHGQRLDRQQRHQLQANWLARSGIDLAVQRLSTDKSYSGEIWNVDDVALVRSGVVEITVAQFNGHTTVNATALYPAESSAPRRARRTYTTDTAN